MTQNRKLLLWLLVGGAVIAISVLGPRPFNLAGILRSSNAEELKVEFTTYMSQARGLQRLELASLKSYEVITKTSEFSILWNFVKLPAMVVETRMPVRYVYYVDFKEPFQIDLVGETAKVLAPPLTPGMPAPDISGYEISVKSGGFMRDKTKAMEELKASITPLLMKRSQENIPAVREIARQELAAFFQVWLKSRDAQNQFKKVEVVFADEAPASPANP